jgi:hypothetical protein
MSRFERLPLACRLTFTLLVADAATMSAQVTRAELVTLTAEVTSLDVATRSITLSGPLGGHIAARVAPEVQNLDQVHVGELVELTYYQSVAVSAHKQGDPTPLFETAEVSTAARGESPDAKVTSQRHATVTVVSVDPEASNIVVQGPEGNVFSTYVERPEIAAKLAVLRPGDQLDVVVTEALAVDLLPARPGSTPSASYAAGTLIVESGEIVQRVGTTLLIRNQRGRMVAVQVDPSTKFVVDGREQTVFDLQPGTRLSRTTFRVTDVAYLGEN